MDLPEIKKRDGNMYLSKKINIKVTHAIFDL